MSAHIRMTLILGGTLAALAFILTVWLEAAPPAADDYNYNACAKASGYGAIASCTRAIDSGRYNGHQLVALFNNRCSEWNGKHDSDKALADCNEAIRIEEATRVAFTGMRALPQRRA